MSRFSRFFKLLLISSATIMLSYSKIRTTISTVQYSPAKLKNTGVILNSSPIVAPYKSEVLSSEEFYPPISQSSKDNLEEMKQLAILNQTEMIQFELKENGIQENISEQFPKISVIFATWRSGSTFLGDLLQSYPATFYHYEPLLHFNMTQVRSGILSIEGLRVLKSLLQCNYSQIEDYISYGKRYKWLHDHNWRLWQHCQNDWRLCWDPQFLMRMCKLFPHQAMKLVRLRLKFAEDLLKDDGFNLRVVHLVRDPRAVWVSRQFPEWCFPNPDCSDPKRLCADMVDDYHSAKQLKIKYPTRFSVLQYEDLSLNTTSGVQTLMKALRLQYSTYIKQFVESHTQYHVDGPFETRRKSSEMPLKWKQFFKGRADELHSIQTVCKEAMQLWGYSPINIKNENGVLEMVEN